MSDKKFRGVRAVKTTKTENIFDENFSIRKDASVLHLSPNEQFSLHGLMNVLSKLVPKLRKKYDEVHIEYTSPERSGSYAIPIADIDDSELASFLLERKETVSVGSTIPQFCNSIHPEFANKLAGRVHAEIKAMEKKYVRKRETSPTSELPED